MLEAGTSVAVLGSSGFIGGALARTLDERGIRCARFTRSEPFLLDAGLAPAVLSADVIFWLVSSVRPANSDESGKASADLIALQTLLERLQDRPGPAPRILAVSSGGTVYDPDYPPPYTERSPVRGANGYGEAMLAVERLLREQAPDHVVLRASNAYGPSQPARRGQGVIAHWLGAVFRDEPIQVLGNPDISRDYLYIDDLVTALLSCAAHPDVPRVVNIGSGVATSLGQLLDVIRQAVGHDVKVEYSPARSFDAPSTWLDVELAARKLGLHPTVQITEGVRRAWAWVRQEGC